MRTLYMATIDQNKIIAYNNNRQEYEVIQHMGVKNIRPISYTEDDIKSALERREYTDWEVTP